MQAHEGPYPEAAGLVVGLTKEVVFAKAGVKTLMCKGCCDSHHVVTSPEDARPQQEPDQMDAAVRDWQALIAAECTETWQAWWNQKLCLSCCCLQL